MPVPKENTITKSWVHNRCSDFQMLRLLCPVGKVLMTRSRDGANTQLWSKPLFTVLLCIDL